MRMMRTISIALVLAACSKSEDPKKDTTRDQQRWKTPRTATVTFGDYVGTIPAGWHDMNDLVDPEETKGMPKQPGSSIMTTEQWARQPDHPNIVVLATPAAGFTPAAAGCDQFAQATAKSNGFKVHDVAVADFQGNPGCRWTIEAEMNGRATIWVKGTQLHMVQCLWFPGHEKTDNEVCERFFATVKTR